MRSWSSPNAGGHVAGDGPLPTPGRRRRTVSGLAAAVAVLFAAIALDPGHNTERGTEPTVDTSSDSSEVVPVSTERGHLWSEKNMYDFIADARREQPHGR